MSSDDSDQGIFGSSELIHVFVSDQSDTTNHISKVGPKSRFPVAMSKVSAAVTLFENRVGQSSVQS